MKEKTEGKEIIAVEDGFRNATLSDFYDKYSASGTKSIIRNLAKFDANEKIKLCSSDDFNEVSNNFIEKYDTGENLTMISHIGGFYVAATLAGIAAYSSDNREAKVLFFDRKNNNLQNALFNTLLMRICKTKEKYITTLFGLADYEIEDALKLNLPYGKVIKDFDKEVVDNFDLDAIIKCAQNKAYNETQHYDQLVSLASDVFKGNMNILFRNLASNITEYLGKEGNYDDLVKYLSEDIALNKNHILLNDNYYNAYRNLTRNDGTGYIKFIDDIDISKEEGVKKLELILKSEKFIPSKKNSDKYPIDVAFVPHIHALKESYSFMKENVEDYVMLDKKAKKGKAVFKEDSTATLNVRDYKSIGAEFIQKELEERKPLTHIEETEKVNGIPKIAFMAGAEFGNIYHNEVDTQNFIDIAIAEHVDTIYIRGLFYSTFFYSDTSRRELTDPKYETLNSRLVEARKLIKRLNDNGIRVVYQMGDQEKQLYNDIFRIYTREQGVKGNNFLARDDLRTEYDWVKPLIKQQLIPYLIRCGEDVVGLSTDDANKTKVSDLCNALKRYNEGNRLGKASKFINPEYLHDNDMFRVVYSTIDKYDEKDESLAVNLLDNTNFSSVTQYAKPNAGVLKMTNYFLTHASNKYELKKIPKIFSDARQGFMSIAYKGDVLAMNVPQMIDDSRYIDHPELLAGIKNNILSDPTHKRVTQTQTKPNYPGGWIVNGDSREIMTIQPYFGRAKEVMNYVQKTGKGLDKVVVGYINDTQNGSITERLRYQVKYEDYLYYVKHVDGIFGNGDFQQGWNYPKFANESRHTAAQSVTQQMVSFIKLQEPYLKNMFGVAKNDIFVGKYGRNYIDEITSYSILLHLYKNNLLIGNDSANGKTFSINKNINYNTVDLKLPVKLRRFEPLIRQKLSELLKLSFYHIVEGNHEYNSDWCYKGYNLVEQIKQEINNLKLTYGDKDLEVELTEFFINRRGDYVNAPYGFKTINGYNIAFGHSYRAPGKGSGGSPTVAMANYFDQMGDDSYSIHRAIMGHLHVFESSVINNKLLTVTGCSAGQSGYEQILGYSSRPLFVVDTYMPDGRIIQETIGTEFLDSYEIQNPEIKAMGLDNFIDKCLTQEATQYCDELDHEPQKIFQRKLVPAAPSKRIGPKI